MESYSSRVLRLNVRFGVCRLHYTMQYDANVSTSCGLIVSMYLNCQIYLLTIFKYRSLYYNLMVGHSQVRCGQVTFIESFVVLRRNTKSDFVLLVICSIDQWAKRSAHVLLDS